MAKENQYAEYEIDLRRYLQIFWDSKYIILLSIFIISGLTFFLSNRFISPLYQGKATLLIMPPSYQTALEFHTLPLATYRHLALTDSMKDKIIKELDLRNLEGEIYPPSYLNGMLEVEISGKEQVRVGDVSVESILMVLVVQHQDPDLASLIANTWAQFFIEDTKEIRTGELKEVSMVIQDRFQSTRQELNRVRESLMSFKEEVRLELAYIEMAALENKLKEYSATLLDLKTNLGSEKLQNQYLKETLGQIEIDGRFIGSISLVDKGVVPSSTVTLYRQLQDNLLDFLSKNNIQLLQQEIDLLTQEIQLSRFELYLLESLYGAGFTYELVDLHKMLALKEGHLKHLKDSLLERELDGRFIGDRDLQGDKEGVSKVRSNYQEAKEALLSFLQAHDVDLLYQKIFMEELMLAGYRSNLLNLQETLYGKELQVKELESLLEQEPPLWELMSSMSPESLWQNILRDEDLSILKDLQLKEQIVNPIYQELKAILSKEKVQLASLAPQIDYYRGLIKELEEGIGADKGLLLEWEQELDNLLLNVAHYRALFLQYGEGYRDMKYEEELLQLEVNSLREQIKYLESQEIHLLHDHIKEYQLGIKEKEEELQQLYHHFNYSLVEVLRMEMDIFTYGGVYAHEAQNYQLIRAQLLESQQKIHELKFQISFYQETLEELKGDVKDLQDYIWQAEIKREDLKQQVNMVENTYKKLADWAEEARTVEAQRTSDVRFVSPAISNLLPRGILLNVAAAGALTFFLSLFLVFLREFMTDGKKETSGHFPQGS